MTEKPKAKSSPVLLVILLLVLVGLGAFWFISKRPQVEVYWTRREEGRAFGEIKNLTDKPLKGLYIVSQYEGPAPEGNGKILQETVAFPVLDATRPAPRDTSNLDGYDTIAPGKAGRFIVPMSAELIKSYRVFTKSGETEKEFNYTTGEDRKPSGPLPQ